MKIRPTTDEATITLLGAFNPQIFHPAWLVLNGLISQEHADNAQIKIVHPDLTQFTAAYMQFQIQPNRFLVKCEEAYKETVKDLVLSVFGEHLPHSKVWKMGINRLIAFSCDSESVRDKLGGALAPKRPWGPWGQQIEQ